MQSTRMTDGNPMKGCTPTNKAICLLGIYYSWAKTEQGHKHIYKIIQ